MIRELLFIHLFATAISQNPPIQIGETIQYVLVKLNTEVNITCPFNDVKFYKWINAKIPSIHLGEQQNLQIRITSATKPETFECEAVNGFGKKNATVIAKGIDISSKQFDIDCQSKESGPCFLVSGISNDFEFTVEENSKLTLDCRAIMNTGNMSTVTYSWSKISLSDTYNIKLQNPSSDQGIKNTGQYLNDVPSIEKVEFVTLADISKWGPLVTIEKVTKVMDGTYQCIVASSRNVIKRTFRIRVKETRSVSIIEGPLNETIRAEIGSTQTLSCKAYTKSTWGKKLDKLDQSPDSQEIINWGGSRYKLLQGTLDLEHKVNGDSTKDSGYYVNNLIMENIQQSQSGIYVCTVLTSSTMDQKYVNLTVEAGSGGNIKNHNFSIYIAVPTTVLIICLATIIYCLVHRRIRQRANFKNRAAHGATATTTNSSSGNGSFSGSKNTSNARQHMLTTTTSSSKGSQNQFGPNNGFNSTAISATAYGPNHQTFSTTVGYTPAVINYNYTGQGPYVQATNNTPTSIDIDNQCPHHNCMSHTKTNNHGHPIPYDSDTTPSPPPPTSVTDGLSIINTSNPQNIIAPYGTSAGVSLNSYSSNQSSQAYNPHNQTPHGSSSTTGSSPNAIYPATQQKQPVYTPGVMYSA